VTIFYPLADLARLAASCSVTVGRAHLLRTNRETSRVLVRAVRRHGAHLTIPHGAKRGATGNTTSAITASSANRRTARSASGGAGATLSTCARAAHC
jgi:hypothetical protein